MAMDELYGGGSGGTYYYANPVNVEEAEDNDDGWFYQEGGSGSSVYDSIINNSGSSGGSDTYTNIIAEPIEEDYTPQYDYSGYLQYSTTPETSEDDYSYTAAKSEAPKPVSAPEQEPVEVEAEPVAETSSGFEWTPVTPTTQPEQTTQESAFVKTAKGSSATDDETKFYSGNPVQQEEAEPRSFVDRLMSFGTSPAYGESQAVTPQPLNLPLNNMQAMQYGINQAMQTYDNYYGNVQPQPAVQTPTVPNNPLSAAGAPNLFQGGSYLPGRRMVLTSTPLATIAPVQIQSANPLITGQTPINGLPEMQMRDYGYRNMPSLSAEIPEAQVSQAGYNGSTHYLGAGPQDLEEPLNPVSNYYGPTNHILGAGPKEELFEAQAHPDELQRYYRNTDELWMPEISMEQYLRGLNGMANPLNTQQTPAFQEGTYEYDFRYGDPRNIPADQIASVYQRMTGDAEGAVKLQQEYERLKGYGLSDRQISADLARMATRNNAELSAMQDQDTIRSLMNPDGTLQFDRNAARQGLLPEDVAVPGVDEIGRWNEALRSIFKWDGDKMLKDDKGNPQLNNYDPYDILDMWLRPYANGSQAYTVNGAGYQGLPDDLPKDVKKFIATSPFGSLMQADNDKQYETVQATGKEWEQALDKFIAAMPALQQLLNYGVLTKEEIGKYFFKGIETKKEEEKTTKKSGGGGGGRGSSSSGGSRRGGGGGGGGSSTPANPPVANQKMSRIFNIMKNWSF